MKSMEWIKIEDLDIYISDGNYSSKYPRSSEFVSSGIPFIRANNFLNKTIAPKEMYFITPEKHQALLKGHVKTGDVLITTRGDLGKTALVPESYNDANINAQIVLLRANSQQIEPKFLIWCFDIPEVKFQITQLQTGTALQQLPVGKLIKIKLPLPPIAEQKRIAEILDRTQSLISKRKEAIAKLDTLTQSIFLEMFGNPVKNLKNIKTLPLAEVCKRITDGTHQPPKWSGSGYPFLFVSNIVSGEITFDTAKFISSETHEELTRRCPIEVNDILYSTVGSYGVPVIVKTERKFAFQRHIAHIKPEANLIDSKFLCAMLASPPLKRQADRAARGVAQKTVNLEEIRKFIIFCPLLPLQKEFAQRVEAVEKLKATHRASLSQLQALFASLQHRAFRGEL